MIKVINIILALVCLALAYFLFQSINNPVKFQNEIEERNQAVYDKLYKIRDAQEAFNNIHGKFAPDFDTLMDVMRTGQYESINRVTGDTIRFNVLDSLFDGDTEKVNDLPIVPHSGGKEFEMGAGVLPSPSDSTLYIPVFEASTFSEVYLGGEDPVNKDYWKSGEKVKIGSLTAPILTGNWE